MSKMHDWHALIQTAQRLVFRNCRGPVLRTLSLGRIDGSVLAKLDGSGSGLFFLDADVWQHAHPKAKDGVAIRGNVIFVRAGSASELLRLLEDGDEKIKRELILRLEALIK